MKQLFLALTCAVALSTTQAETIVSRRTSAPINIDGVSDEWSTRLKYFHAESTLQYEISNDDEYLYLIFKTADQTVANQLSSAGWKLRFSANTPNRFSASIDFPSRNESVPFMPAPPPMDDFGMNNSTPETEKNKLMPPSPNDEDYALVQNFIYSKNNEITPNKVDNSTVRYACNNGRNGEKVYEFSIPLREIFGDGFDKNIISNTNFKLRIQINGSTSNSSGGFAGGPPSDDPGGMDGGGIPPSGERPNFMNEISTQKTYSKKQFTIKFGLAPKF